MSDTEIYLDEESKKSYSIDFQNVLVTEVEGWKLDNELLREVLIQINENGQIQSLYSQYNKRHDGNRSYFTFCYTEDVELKIFRELIPILIEQHSTSSPSRNIICNYKFFRPRDNGNYVEGAAPLGLRCIDDKYYFRINHIQINFTSPLDADHDNFWNGLTILKDL